MIVRAEPRNLLFPFEASLRSPSAFFLKLNGRAVVHLCSSSLCLLLFSLSALNDSLQFLPYDSRRLSSVDAIPYSLFLVVSSYGVGLFVVGLEALLERLGVVVGSLDEGLACYVVFACDLGWSNYFEEHQMLMSITIESALLVRQVIERGREGK